MSIGENFRQFFKRDKNTKADPQADGDDLLPSDAENKAPQESKELRIKQEFEETKKSFIEFFYEYRDLPQECQSKLEEWKAQVNRIIWDYHGLEAKGTETEEEIQQNLAEILKLIKKANELIDAYKEKTAILYLQNEFKDQKGVEFLDKEKIKEEYGAKLEELIFNFAKSPSELLAKLEQDQELKTMMEVLNLSKDDLELMLAAAKGMTVEELKKEDLLQEQSKHSSATSRKKFVLYLRKAGKQFGTNIGASIGLSATATAIGLTGGVSLVAVSAGMVGWRAGARCLDKTLEDRRYGKRVEKGISGDNTNPEIAKQYQENLISLLQVSLVEKLREQKEGKPETIDYETLRQDYIDGKMSKDELRKGITEIRKQYLEKLQDSSLPQDERELLEQAVAALQTTLMTESGLDFEKAMLAARREKLPSKEEKKKGRISRITKELSSKELVVSTLYGTLTRIAYQLPHIGRALSAYGGAALGASAFEAAFSGSDKFKDHTIRRKLVKSLFMLGGAAAMGFFGEIVRPDKAEAGNQEVRYTDIDSVDDWLNNASHWLEEKGKPLGELEEKALGLIGLGNDHEILVDPNKEKFKNVDQLINYLKEQKLLPDDGAVTSEDSVKIHEIISKIPINSETQSLIDGIKHNDILSHFLRTSQDSARTDVDASEYQAAAASQTTPTHFENTIDNPNAQGAHDSIWRSTRDIFLKDAKNLGYDEQTDGDRNQWAETQTANVIKQLTAEQGGHLKDLVHGPQVEGDMGDKVTIDFKDGKPHLSFVQNPDGPQASYLPEVKAQANIAESHSEGAPTVPLAQKGSFPYDSDYNPDGKYVPDNSPPLPVLPEHPQTLADLIQTKLEHNEYTQDEMRLENSLLQLKNPKLEQYHESAEKYILDYAQNHPERVETIQELHDFIEARNASTISASVPDQSGPEQTPQTEPIGHAVEGKDLGIATNQNETNSTTLTSSKTPIESGIAHAGGGIAETAQTPAHKMSPFNKFGPGYGHDGPPHTEILHHQKSVLSEPTIQETDSTHTPAETLAYTKLGIDESHAKEIFKTMRDIVGSWVPTEQDDTKFEYFKDIFKDQDESKTLTALISARDTDIPHLASLTQEQLASYEKVRMVVEQNLKTQISLGTAGEGVVKQLGEIQKLGTYTHSLMTEKGINAPILMPHFETVATAEVPATHTTIESLPIKESSVQHGIKESELQEVRNIPQTEFGKTQELETINQDSKWLSKELSHHFWQKPNPETLAAHTESLARDLGLEHGQEKFFLNWLAGEDGILKKGDFSHMVKNGNLDIESFAKKITEFEKLAESKDLPGKNWEPRVLLNENGKEYLANVRKTPIQPPEKGVISVPSSNYEIDKTGDGKADTACWLPDLLKVLGIEKK